MTVSPAVRAGELCHDAPRNPLRGCRVTVLRRECFADLQSRYLADPDEGPCAVFTEGQRFEVAADGRCPEGFCPKAWECLRGHVAQLMSRSAAACGVSSPDRAVIACCGDGTRPVIFKIEACGDDVAATLFDKHDNML